MTAGMAPARMGGTGAATSFSSRVAAHLRIAEMMDQRAFCRVARVTLPASRWDTFFIAFNFNTVFLLVAVSAREGSADFDLTLEQEVELETKLVRRKKETMRVIKETD